MSERQGERVFVRARESERKRDSVRDRRGKEGMRRIERDGD